MPRPKRHRFLRFKPHTHYFKPRGIPMRYLEEVILEADELETIKLHDVDELNHVESAKKMNISQPTFGRILDSAYKKIADALINGKAIRIDKN